MGNCHSGTTGVEFADVEDECFPASNVATSVSSHSDPESLPVVYLSCPCEEGRHSLNLRKDNLLLLTNYVKVWTFFAGKGIRLSNQDFSGVFTENTVYSNSGLCSVVLLVHATANSATCRSEGNLCSAARSDPQCSLGNRFLQMLHMECLSRLKAEADASSLFPVYSTETDPAFETIRSADQNRGCTCHLSFDIYILQGHDAASETVSIAKNFSHVLMRNLQIGSSDGFSFTYLSNLFQLRRRYSLKSLLVIPRSAQDTLSDFDQAPKELKLLRSLFSSSCVSQFTSPMCHSSTSRKFLSWKPGGTLNSANCSEDIISPRSMSAAIAATSPTVAALAVSPRGVRRAPLRSSAPSQRPLLPFTSLSSQAGSSALKSPTNRRSADVVSTRGAERTRREGTSFFSGSTMQESPGYCTAGRTDTHPTSPVLRWSERLKRERDRSNDSSILSEGASSLVYSQDVDADVEVERASDSGYESEMLSFRGSRSRSAEGMRNYDNSVQTDSTSENLSQETPRRSGLSPRTMERVSESYSSSSLLSSGDICLDDFEPPSSDSVPPCPITLQKINKCPPLPVGSAKKSIPGLNLGALGRTQRPLVPVISIQEKSVNKTMESLVSAPLRDESDERLFKFEQDAALSVDSSYSASAASDEEKLLFGQHSHSEAQRLLKRRRGSTVVPGLKLSALSNTTKLQFTGTTSVSPLSPDVDRVVQEAGSATVGGDAAIIAHCERVTTRRSSCRISGAPLDYSRNASFEEETFNDLCESKEGLLDRYRHVCSEVIPNGRIYISGALVSQNYSLLQDTGITHIINVAGDSCRNFYRDSFHYLTFVLHDNRLASEELQAILFYVLEYIDYHLRDPSHRVLIHCREGVSRSATVVIAYLMWKGKTVFRDALDIVRTARPCCNPNTGFTFVLLRFGKLLRAQTQSSGLSPLAKQALSSPGKRTEYNGNASAESADLVVYPCGNDTTLNGTAIYGVEDSRAFIDMLKSFINIVTVPGSVKDVPLVERRLLRFSPHHPDAPFVVPLGVSLFEATQGVWMPDVQAGLDPRFYYILRDDSNIYLWRGSESLHWSLIEAVFMADYIRQLYLFEGGTSLHDWRVMWIEDGEEPDCFWRLLNNATKEALWDTSRRVQHQRQLDELYAVMRDAEDLCNFNDYCRRQHCKSYPSSFDAVSVHEWDETPYGFGSGGVNVASLRYQGSTVTSSPTTAQSATLYAPSYGSLETNANNVRFTASPMDVPSLVGRSSLSGSSGLVSNTLLTNDAQSARSNGFSYASPKTLKGGLAVSPMVLGSRGNTSGRNSGRSLVGCPCLAPTVRRRFTVTSPSPGICLQKDDLRLSLLDGSSLQHGLSPQKSVILPPVNVLESCHTAVGIEEGTGREHDDLRPSLSRVTLNPFPPQPSSTDVVYITSPTPLEPDQPTSDTSRNTCFNQLQNLGSSGGLISVHSGRGQMNPSNPVPARQCSHPGVSAAGPSDFYNDASVSTLPGSDPLGTASAIVTTNMKSVKVREGDVELEPDVPYLYIWPRLHQPLDVFDDDQLCSNTLCIIVQFGPRPLLEMLSRRQGVCETSAKPVSVQHDELDTPGVSPCHAAYQSLQLLMVVTEESVPTTSLSATPRNVGYATEGSTVGITDAPIQKHSSCLTLCPMDSGNSAGLYRSIEILPEAACVNLKLPLQANLPSLSVDTPAPTGTPYLAPVPSPTSMIEQSEDYSARQNFTDGIPDGQGSDGNESMSSYNEVGKRLGCTGSSVRSATASFSELLPQIKEVEIVATVTPTSLWVWRGREWLSTLLDHPSDESILDQFKVGHGILPDDQDLRVFWEVEGEESDTFQKLLWLS